MVRGALVTPELLQVAGSTMSPSPPQRAVRGTPVHRRMTGTTSQLFANATSPVLDDCRPSSPTKDSVGSRALCTIDESLVASMMATEGMWRLRQLGSSLCPFTHTGSWLIWMVRRIALDDPTLKEADFTCKIFPTGAEEPRIARALAEALVSNTHLQVLKCNMTNFCGRLEAQSLAASLRRNQTLRVLELESNSLEPVDLEAIVSALEENHALEVLRLSNQFVEEEAGDETFSAIVRVLKRNYVLRILGVHVTNQFHRNEIDRALIRNWDTARSGRRYLQLEEQQAQRTAARHAEADALRAGLQQRWRSQPYR